MTEIGIFLILGCIAVLVFNYAAGDLNEKHDRDSFDLYKRMLNDTEKTGLEDKLKNARKRH